LLCLPMSVSVPVVMLSKLLVGLMMNSRSLSRYAPLILLPPSSLCSLRALTRSPLQPLKLNDERRKWEFRVDTMDELIMWAESFQKIAMLSDHEHRLSEMD
jgi:hypothetical protein